MPTCFVMQPFDGGQFDKRYDDALVPAIATAGYDAYRVDRDPSVEIPIDQIEAGIRNADTCVADITVDNPNVWFELGYAIACNKDVVLICSAERMSRFPFDVQHRNIIRYKAESPRDFDELRDKMVDRLKAIQRKAVRFERIGDKSGIAPVEGLAQHELLALVAIAQNVYTPTDTVYPSTVRNDLERMGFTGVAATLAISTLLRKGLIVSFDHEDINGSYPVYCLSDDGLDWLERNQHLLELKQSSNADDLGESDPFADE